jgi:hypothetical protein
MYQITYSGEGKTVEFSPHQVVIKDLKDPKHILTTRIVKKVHRKKIRGTSSIELKVEFAPIIHSFCQYFMLARGVFLLV